ncbi:hypothetical protein EMIHUDRAFT_200466 [Emiliania huxleyi CCMP1516]|uniref:EF-hand domain-containing protein n=2 Tax=Emiliania huxleyi TaxID=2903 RepID=A0A0D3KQL9_EMIH1|nr:hypothetical protein EMIHUDRAFT_200466 [Emiliania huxleyi CCMP1516]EOD38054.1 hypothetical protein EMIHUDRAFT_200466 [Emiliania huxleyi CCMP1516]|eukprot:XP_005790483.1 hypothetical protein EMIHUDRAFT_200466 [Emiliania huxleyi CCMP1516]
MLFSAFDARGEGALDYTQAQQALQWLMRTPADGGAKPEVPLACPAEAYDAAGGLRLERPWFFMLYRTMPNQRGGRLRSFVTVHNQGLATSVSIMVKPMGQKWRERPSQVAGGYTSGRRAGGGAGAQAHFPGDPEGEEAGRVAATHC